MNNTSILISVVLYKHTVEDIKPLLISIKKLESIGLGRDIELALYDGSPKGSDYINLGELTETLGGSIKYKYEAGDNVGYGGGNNINIKGWNSSMKKTVIISNPDIYFNPDAILTLTREIDNDDEIACLAPLIENNNEEIQYSAKRNPTVLSLMIGRLRILRRLKPLLMYYEWHTNKRRDYKTESSDCTYLSGCFLCIRYKSLQKIGGFDERYFLHLEDADLTRSLSMIGKCRHYPQAKIIHGWARGSHKSIRQTTYLLWSLIKYMQKWGLKIW